MLLFGLPRLAQFHARFAYGSCQNRPLNAGSVPSRQPAPLAAYVCRPPTPHPWLSHRTSLGPHSSYEVVCVDELIKGEVVGTSVSGTGNGISTTGCGFSIGEGFAGKAAV